MKAKDLGHWMRLNDYTDTQLGEALGRSRETVNRWRNDKRTIPAWVETALRGLENASKREE